MIRAYQMAPGKYTFFVDAMTAFVYVLSMETKATKTAAEMLNEYHNAILPMAQAISQKAYTADRVASLAKYVGVCESKFSTESLAYYAAEAIIVLDKKPLSWMAA